MLGHRNYILSDFGNGGMPGMGQQSMTSRKPWRLQRDAW